MAQASSSLVVDADWSHGIVRDAPRTSIPEGSLYNSIDWLLHQPGRAQKRGGTSYAGPAMSGSTYALAVAYAEFEAGGQVIALGYTGGNPDLYTVTSGTTTDKGAIAGPVAEVPKFRIGGGKNFLILAISDGSSVPRTWNGTTVATLGGSPPAGKFSCIYKSRLVLGNTSANPDRLYFSPVPDIESTWDTTNSWIDTGYPITGLAALQNTIIVFSQRHTQRITGTTPPPGTDMDLAPVGDIGCTDARSIAVFENKAVFANPRGVYMTNGNSFDSLTANAGGETYWQSLFTGYDPATWTIASGVYRSFLLVSVMNGSTFVDCIMFNLRRPSWWRLGNIKATMFATAVGVADELYYADRSTNRIVAISGIFTPSASNKNDADGTAVTPELETRILAAGPTLKHFGLGHLSLDMRDAASDNPTMALRVAPGLEATTTTAVSESPLAEATDSTRYRFTVAKVSQGVTVKLSQANASSKTELYGIELEARGLPLLAGGQ